MYNSTIQQYVLLNSNYLFIYFDVIKTNIPTLLLLTTYLFWYFNDQDVYT